MGPRFGSPAWVSVWVPVRVPIWVPALVPVWVPGLDLGLGVPVWGLVYDLYRFFAFKQAVPTAAHS